ncbi:hypothetical protein BS78_06G238200 [Paspalum vaginatum]|nr:hypothetical protein BS78_06G238200 [Paspalum vaginatum]
MAYKVKGILKGLKTISRIFAAKEHEMEIGHPTDVKHVAHIGWGDTAAGTASPSWINGIMASSDLLSLENIAASAATGIPWVSSEGLDRQPRGTHQPSGADVPRPPRRKKPKPKDGLPTAPSRPSSSSMNEAAPPPLSAAPDVAIPANGTP